MLPGYVQALSPSPFNTIFGRHAFADEVNAQTHLTWMMGKGLWTQPGSMDPMDAMNPMSYGSNGWLINLFI